MLMRRTHLSGPEESEREPEQSRGWSERVELSVKVSEDEREMSGAGHNDDPARLSVLHRAARHHTAHLVREIGTNI